MTRNTIVNEPDRVVIYDDLARDVISNVTFSSTPNVAAFDADFEILTEPHDWFLADPDESFYQGVAVVTVIRRKSDGRLFGFPWWTPIAKHGGEPSIEPNGDDHGLEFDQPDGFDWENDYYPEPFVFLPVEPFTITGWKVAEAADDEGGAR